MATLPELKDVEVFYGSNGIVANATRRSMRSPAHTNRSAVVHLAQSDREGGANRAAYRLHKALLTAGVGSTFHCGRKLGEGNRRSLGRPRSRRGPPRRSPRTLMRGRCAPTRIEARLPSPRSSSAMVASTPTYWRVPMSSACTGIAGAFLTPAKLARVRRPLVWRLSDLWPFTGGCHYPGNCRRFESECGCCPVLGSTEEEESLARRLSCPRAGL